MSLNQFERLATRLLGWKAILFCAVIAFVLVGWVASRQPVSTASIIATHASVTAGTFALATLSLVHWFAVPTTSPQLSRYRRMTWFGKTYAVFSTVLLAAQAVFAVWFSYSMLAMLP